MNRYVVSVRQVARTLSGVVVLWALWLSPGHAIELRVTPVDQTVAVGAIAEVNLALTNPNSILVGAFDIGLTFDPGILNFESAVFGSALGGLPQFQDVTPGVGQVTLAEVSLFDLSILQDGLSDFVLATLRFSAVSSGISALTLLPNIAGSTPGFIGDGAGVLIGLDATFDGQITVTDAVAVPAPGVGLLVLVGLGFLALLSTRWHANRGLRALSGAAR